MGLTDLFDAKRAGSFSALTFLVEAALALYSGDKRLAALLMGAAALAYRWRPLGDIAYGLIWLYRWIR